MTEWRKSSRCEANNCVEVNLAERVGVRDSAGRVVAFTPEQWRAFIGALQERKTS